MTTRSIDAGDTNFLDPVDEILAIWNTFADAIAADKLWGDQGNDRNVIIDAEALLAFMLPEMAIDRLSFSSDDGLILVASDKAAGVSIARVSGDKYTTDLPGESRRALLDRLLDFYESNGGEQPNFVGGTYLTVNQGAVGDPDADSVEGEVGGDAERDEDLEKNVEVVDAYTYSITLSLATLQLIERWFPKSGASATRSEEIDRLKLMASLRLTDALEGLTDSFAVDGALSVSTWENNTKRIWPKSNTALTAVRRRLQQINSDIPLSPRGAFEIGWSWGPVPEGDRLFPSGREYPYLATNAPYLYFTVGALDGVKDLFSDDVQAASILTDEQQGLVQTLRVMYDLTVKYWAALALDESSGRWAIEDVPWTTADGDSSEYWTLYLLRVALSQLDASEHESSRLIDLAQELAQRARITRKPVPPESDKALGLHWPGEELVLDTAEPLASGQELSWAVYDFAPQLLKLTGQLQERISAAQDRAELGNLVGDIWAHLGNRRETTGPGVNAWDTFEKVYEEWFEESLQEAHDSRSRPDSAIGSWYITERVVEALVSVAAGDLKRPLVPTSMRSFLFELVSEMDHRMAIEDSRADADHGEIQKRRVEIHEARRALLSNDPSACLERLVAIMVSQDAGSRAEK